MDFYDKHPGYKWLKKRLVEEYGVAVAERIYAFATAELAKLKDTFDGLTKAEKFHTDDNILPRIAMYRAIKTELSQERAIILLDEAIQNTAKKVNGLLSKITRIPGMPMAMIKLMSLMVKRLYGEKAGFKLMFYTDTKNELCFDITQCPYCRYCELCGCPELTETFCKSDEYCYGNIPNVLFERSGTLGTGSNCCDFLFKTERQK